MVGLATMLPAMHYDGSAVGLPLNGGDSVDDVDDGHEIEDNAVIVPVDHLELRHSVRLPGLQIQTTTT